MTVNASSASGATSPPSAGSDASGSADVPWADPPLPRAAVFAERVQAPDASPPCAYCDSAPSDPMAGMTPAVANLDPVRAAATSLQTFIDAYDGLWDTHHRALRELTAALRHTEELHTLLCPRFETAQAFVEFAQRRYDVSQETLRIATQREAEMVQDMERMLQELSELGTIRSRHTMMEETSAEAYRQLQDYAASLEHQLAGGAAPEDTLTNTFVRDLMDLRQETQQLMARSSNLENQVRSSEKLRGIAEDARNQARRARGSYATRVDDLRIRVDNLTAENQQLRADIDQLTAHDESPHPGESVSGMRLEIHVRGERIRELETDLARVRRRREDIRHALEHSQRRRQDLEAEMAALKRRVAGLDRDCARAVDNLHVCEDRLRGLQSKEDSLIRERDSLKLDLKAARPDLQTAQGRLGRANHKVAALNRLRQVHDKAIADTKRVSNERDDALHKLGLATQDLDRVRQGLGSARQDRDTAVQAKDAADREWKEAVQEKRSAALARDSALSERDVALSSLERAVQDRTTAIEGRDHALRAHAILKSHVDSKENPVKTRLELLAHISDIQAAYLRLRLDYDDLLQEHVSLSAGYDDLVTGDPDASLQGLARLAETASRGSAADGSRSGASETHPTTERSRDQAVDVSSTGSDPPAKVARVSHTQTASEPSLQSPVPTDPVVTAQDPSFPVTPTRRSVRLGSSSYPSRPTVSPGAGPEDDREDADYEFSDAGSNPSGSSSMAGSNITPVQDDDSDSIFDDSDEEELRMAQARSRSEARRRRLSSVEGSAAAPVVIDNAADPSDPLGNSSSDDSSDVGGPPEGSSATDPHRDDPTPTDLVGNTLDDGNLAPAGDAVVVRDPEFQPYGPFEASIHGLREPRALSASDVQPWNAEELSGLSLTTITPRLVRDLRVLTPGWLFPPRQGRGGALDPKLYLQSLVTKANVEYLYSKKPWEVLERPDLSPLTYDPAGSTQLARVQDSYEDHERADRQAMWEATHLFPITSKMKKDPYWRSFYQIRKNRNSHARERSRAIEAQVFEAARQTGCCDADLLLDPKFTRFPLQSEDATWFPGREAIAEERDPPRDLYEALADCDRADA